MDGVLNMEEKNIDIVDALNSLVPNADWSLIGDEYDGITWLDDSVEKPSKMQIENEILRLQAEYDALEYQRLRKNEYPLIEDQLDILYHQGYDGWKDIITQIKEKHPKTNG